jgi:hypothetical protein
LGRDDDRRRDVLMLHFITSAFIMMSSTPMEPDADLRIHQTKVLPTRSYQFPARGAAVSRNQYQRLMDDCALREHPV